MNWELTNQELTNRELANWQYRTIFCVCVYVEHDRLRHCWAPVYCMVIVCSCLLHGIILMLQAKSDCLHYAISKKQHSFLPDRVFIYMYPMEFDVDSHRI